ncbi:hypothetical protein BDF14DRAFT_1995830 [Spinellus fusiger]|nr:hypothetical protein BDF14DRAFT_1995830 [Spinellus fusiger]
MSLQVNFSTHSQDLDAAYQSVLSETEPQDWLICSYDKGTNDLKVQATGDGGLEALEEEFMDGKIQYAFARVLDPNTELYKFVLIGWCGSGVQETKKGFFSSHLRDVSSFFKGYHLQIHARDEADVTPELIKKRVSESSGANYSVHKEVRRAQPAVTPVNSVYAKTQVPDIAAMQRLSMKTEGPPPPVGTNYTPVQTKPRPLSNRWSVPQQDTGAAAVRAEREKAEREVREREQQMERERMQSGRALDQQKQEEEAAQREREAVAQREREAAQRAQAEAAQRAQAEAAQREREAAEKEQLAREEEQRAAAIAAMTTTTYREEEQDTLHTQLDQTAEHAADHASHFAETAIMQNEQHDTGVHALVLFEYDAAEANEMSLIEGEVITNIDQVDDGWWFGVGENGDKQGLFPANYVQIMEHSAPVEEPAHPAYSEAPHEAPITTPQHDMGQTAIALYEYVAGEDNEISFQEQDIITHIEFVSEEWWQGRSPDGQSEGLFPGKFYYLFTTVLIHCLANYVELQ